MSDSWYSKSVAAVYEALHTKEEGLSEAEAVARLTKFGKNVLPEGKRDSLVVIFFRQFRSPLIYVLIGAAGIVLVIEEVSNALIIFAVLVFNAIVGTIQEGKAQNTLSALKNFVATKATVLRDGAEIIIPDAEVVPGDMLVLQEGERVPADARVVHANTIKVDEAALTGESTPVHKIADIVEAKNLGTQEQKNMIFRGTYLVSGSGRAVVVATGIHTVIGGIAQKITAIDSEMPLRRDIRALSRLIIVVAVAIAFGLFTFGTIAGKGVVEMFTTVVALSVSIIPEGLPIVITVVLATGVWRMSKRNALVKKLQAVEALGQAKVIAVDKTGTITKNELMVERVWAGGAEFRVGGVGYEPKGTVHKGDAEVDPPNHPELLFMGKIAAMSANARVIFSEREKRYQVSGDPTEAAILVLGQKLGFHKTALLQESPLISELAFDYKLKYHATLNRVGHEKFLSVVGAPESILALCKHFYDGHKSHVLTKEKREELEKVFLALSGLALRVVAVAINREYPHDTLDAKEIHGLTFVGFFGMKDALRAEVALAMDQAKEAGVNVIMITGDHKETAVAIAKEADIYTEGDGVLTGAEVEALPEAEFIAKLPGVSVFARVTPEHKLRIISGFKARGEVIAMTGDGVNDAPSLVAADLGVAMGGIGTEVAREAADIVLLDDNFGSIIAAIEEGRNMYKTIKKVVLFLFSTSFGEVLTILGAMIVGLPLPLLPAQIIWLNFVTDPFLTIAHALGRKEEGLLEGRFQKPNKYLVDSLIGWRMVFMALPMSLGTLYLFSTYLNLDPAKALTMSLTVLAVFQWFNAWNCLSESKSLFTSNPFKNPYLILATATVFSLQILAIYNPFLQSVLNTVPLSLNDWLLIVPVALSIVLVEEVRKFFYRGSMI